MKKNTRAYLSLFIFGIIAFAMSISERGLWLGILHAVIIILISLGIGMLIIKWIEKGK